MNDPRVFQYLWSMRLDVENGFRVSIYALKFIKAGFLRLPFFGWSVDGIGVAFLDFAIKMTPAGAEENPGKEKSMACFHSVLPGRERILDVIEQRLRNQRLVTVGDKCLLMDANLADVKGIPEKA